LHLLLSLLLTMNVPGAVLLAPSANAKYDTMYYLKGAAAGGICCSITHGALTPVDVVKTRVQLDPLKVSRVCTSIADNEYSTFQGVKASTLFIFPFRLSHLKAQGSIAGRNLMNAVYLFTYHGGTQWWIF
jgi:Mitochondrial carrier protein